MNLFRVDHEIINLLVDMEVEEIESFITLQEDLASDDQIELYIVATLLLFTKSNLAQHLIQAIQHMEGWIAVTSADHVDRSRRSQIFDWMLAARLRLGPIQEEVVGSLREARQDETFEETDHINQTCQDNPVENSHQTCPVECEASGETSTPVNHNTSERFAKDLALAIEGILESSDSRLEEWRSAISDSIDTHFTTQRGLQHLSTISHAVLDIVQQLHKQDERFAFIQSALEEFHDGDYGLDNLLRHHSLELPSVLSAQPNHQWNRSDIAAGMRVLCEFLKRYNECLPDDEINRPSLRPIVDEFINSTIFELLHVFDIDLTKHPGLDEKSPENTPSGFSLLQRLYEETRNLQPKATRESLCRSESVEPKKQDEKPTAGFQYHCVLDPSKPEVRVLKILPGVEADPIECHLVVRNLHTDGIEEALSYVWGTDATPVPIQLDNEIFYIRRNLHSILRRLRHENKPRSIWVDAICVNQSDNKEKSHQVRLMRDIYSRADQTIIWMGDFCIETMAKKGSTDDTYPPLPTGFGGISINEYDLPAIVNEHLKCLEEPISEKRIAIQFMLVRCINHILWHEWWERIWTVQEASLPSKAPIIIFKDCSFSFDNLMGAMNLLLKLKSITFRGGEIGNELEEMLRANGTIPLCHGYKIRRFHARAPLLFQLRPGLERQRDAGIRTLGYILTITDSYKATNPLDKIFALESLLPRCVGRLINVDYSEDYETVFRRITARVYCSRGLLLVKFYRFCFETTLAAGITLKGPSWVIHFTYSDASERAEKMEWLVENRVTLDEFLFGYEIIDVSADADETGILPFATPKTLFCHGRCIDRIQITGLVPKSDEEPGEGYLEAILSLIYESIASHELIGKSEGFAFRAKPLLDLFCMIPEMKVDKLQERHAYSGTFVKSRNQELFGKTYFITTGGIVGISTVPVEQGDVLARIHTAPVYLILRDVEDAKGKSTAPQQHRIIARAAIAEALDNTRERILSAPDQEFQIV